MIKSQKGITLVSLIITVILLLILTSTIAYNLNYSNKAVGYNNMIADIKLLEDKILVYFNKYGEIPKTSRTIEIDNIEYYEIDLSKLDDITLMYGKDYNKSGNLENTLDVYLANSSLQVYYLRGMELSGKIHHTRGQD